MTHQPTDLTNPTDPTVIAGLTHTCECGAQPGNPCTNTINPSEPLPGNRKIHYNRTQIQENNTTTTPSLHPQATKSPPCPQS